MGAVMVGGGWYGTNPASPCDLLSAFRWEESTGNVLMPTQDGDFTRAQAVSADGHVVVGFDTALNGLRRGVKWVDGKHELIQGPLAEVVSAWAVNRDGTVIGGSGWTSTFRTSRPAHGVTAAGGSDATRRSRPPG